MARRPTPRDAARPGAGLFQGRLRGPRPGFPGRMYGRVGPPWRRIALAEEAALVRHRRVWRRPEFYVRRRHGKTCRPAGCMIYLPAQTAPLGRVRATQRRALEIPGPFGEPLCAAFRGGASAADCVHETRNACPPSNSSTEPGRPSRTRPSPPPATGPMAREYFITPLYP